MTYARNTGFHTSDTTWYREKNKLEKLKLKRLYSIAKTGFEEQRFERIDKPELVEKLVFPELLMHKLLVLIIVKCHYKM